MLAQDVISSFDDFDWIEDLIHLRIPEAEAKTLLLALTPDKITLPLLTHLVAVMSQTSVPLPALPEDLMDCCGTGGSGLPHYNTSTTVAFVLAAGGVKVVKFGNRAASSKSGSFDFLEAIGIPAEFPLERSPEVLAQTGLAFLFAPQCYPALAPLAKLRKEIGTRTVFNFLGPLLNPVKPMYRLLGVSHPGMQRLMAEYLAEHLPTRHSWLVYGGQSDTIPAGNHASEINAKGLDEISAHGKTRLLQVRGNHILEKNLTHQFSGNSSGNLSKKCDYTVPENLAIFNALIAGDDTISICHRMVCLNAGAGFVVAGKADSLEAGMALAEDLLAGGKVRETVEQCRRVYGREA